MKNPLLLNRILIWRLRNIDDRHMVLFLSFIVGILSGLAAIILKNLVYYTHYLMTNGFNFAMTNFMYFAYPMFGIVLSVLFVTFIIRDNISHGITRILYAISKNKATIKPHNTYSSMIGSSLTVGFGGSVGLEAPIVLTGSAIGSNLGRIFRLHYKTMVLLIGCGSAGAIAGIFKAPIAGVVFAIEVLMIDLTMTTAIPLLISSVTSAGIAYLLMGRGVVFSFPVSYHFTFSEIPYFILLGIFAGFVSLYFARMSYFVESVFGRINKIYVRVLSGGTILGLLIFLFPALLGEGYEALMDILTGKGEIIVNQSLFGELTDNKWIFLLFLLIIIILKVIAMSTTTGSGGIGGVFAPSLFIGGITGFFTGRLINNFVELKVNESIFSLVGMAGIMAGVMHAPLTAIFLIAEITGGYELFPQLIITSTISYLTIVYFESYSIYTKRLATRGELITHDKDKAVLSMLKLEKLIEKNFKTVHPDAMLGDLVKTIADSSRNIFPVVDEKNNFCGLVVMDNIRHIIFNPNLYTKTRVKDLMIIPETTVGLNESMEEVAKKFQKTGKFNLVVLENGKYIGCVSRAQVFSTYRNMIRDFSED